MVSINRKLPYLLTTTEAPVLVRVTAAHLFMEGFTEPNLVKCRSVVLGLLSSKPVRKGIIRFLSEALICLCAGLTQ